MSCLQLANRSVAETTSAVDWELPKLVAEKFEKPESERQDPTPVDSDSEGVLVELSLNLL